MNMSRFSFLTETTFFSNTNIEDEFLCYNYDLGVRHLGYVVVSEIMIPIVPSNTLEWKCNYNNKTLESGYHALAECPSWFEDLVNRAQDELNYRERLRNLFR